MKQETYRTLYVAGLIGLVVQLVINLMVFALKKTEFLSEQWWSDFFPGYVIWFVFAVIGFAGTRDRNTTGRELAKQEFRSV